MNNKMKYSMGGKKYSMGGKKYGMGGKSYMKAGGKFVVRPCSNPGTPFAVWQTSPGGTSDKRIKGFKTRLQANQFISKQKLQNGGKVSDAVIRYKEGQLKNAERLAKNFSKESNRLKKLGINSGQASKDSTAAVKWRRNAKSLRDYLNRNR